MNKTELIEMNREKIMDAIREADRRVYESLGRIQISIYITADSEIEILEDIDGGNSSIRNDYNPIYHIITIQHSGFNPENIDGWTDECDLNDVIDQFIYETDYNEMLEMENKNLWYAVMMDRDDNDWGYGSLDREEAIKMLGEAREDHEYAYIAVIEDDLCIEEIY